MNILNKIWNEDCVGEGVGMNRIADQSVDMILCDLPYGTTACKWDNIIPFDLLWKQYERVIKDNGVIVLTASQPFTSALVMSNPKLFRYDMIWIKTKASNFQHARRMPMKRHEDILVFYKKLPQYNLDLVKLDKPIKNSRKNKGANIMNGLISDNGDYMQMETGFKFSDIYFSNASGSGHLHPTQKPVALFEYLIRTYTNEGDLVLDNCAGSFTTAVACENLRRNWICMEQDREYCKIGWKRIQENRIRLQEYTPQLTK